MNGELGLPRVHLRRTDSTNLRARELAAGGAPHGTLVTAAEQTAGRGRQGRSWSAPPGEALLCSIVLRSPPALLPLIAAVAVTDVVPARIKWPNDVVVATGEGTLRKLGGILAEGRPQEGWAVLGIGLNVAVRAFPPELEGIAASLGREPEAIEEILQGLLGALGERLAAPVAETLSRWRERDALHGARVGWAGGEGTAAGIDGDGRLVVVLDDGGRATLEAGEVHLQVGPPG